MGVQEYSLRATPIWSIPLIRAESHILNQCQIRYVGRKFASLKSIASGRKAFAFDDGRVNRKKSQKSLYNKIWSLKSVCRYFSTPKSVRRFFEKKSS